MFVVLKWKNVSDFLLVYFFFSGVAVICLFCRFVAMLFPSFSVFVDMPRTRDWFLVFETSAFVCSFSRTCPLS